LWQEYREQNPAGYQYSWFNELYGQWKKGLSISMRQVHKAGEKLFVDYCDGEGVPIIEPVTGKITQTQLFVGVWGASNYTYAEASYGQEKQDWIMSHVRALEYFGCVPHIVVPDNLKTGVNKACKYEPELNRTYLSLAQYYGFAVIPCRVRRPKDKAKVEKGVNMAQRWILACLRNHKFYSLSELNVAIRELLEKLNNRKMKKLDRSRKEMFEEVDKPAALSLPLSGQRYEYADWKKCMVNIDYHIEIEDNFYSVRYQLIHQPVDVRITERMIEVFHRGRRETSHIRSYQVNYHSTYQEHMPEAHRQYLDQTPSKMIAWAETVGPHTVELIKKIFESRRYIQQSYRSCLGIRRLEGHYSRPRLENACRRAVRYQLYSYRSIKAILSGGLDNRPDSVNQPEQISPVHENIRGGGYYTEGVLNH
jgi:transposase